MYTLRTRFKKEIVSEFLPPKKRSNKVIIICGGMPSYPSKRELQFFFRKKNFWSFVPRYRGSWESDGTFMRKSPHLDVLDIVDSLPKGFADFLKISSTWVREFPAGEYTRKRKRYASALPAPFQSIILIFKRDSINSGFWPAIRAWWNGRNTAYGKHDGLLNGRRDKLYLVVSKVGLDWSLW